MTTIEPATLDDLEALVDAWVQLADEQRAHGSHLRPEANRDPVRDSLGTHVMSRGVLVARDDGDLVGFVMYGFDDSGFETDRQRGVVRNAWVAPEYRDGGLGSELFERAERDLARRGADVITLAVMADNEAARRLYRRRGYEPHRVRMAKPAPEVDEDEESDGENR